MSMDPMSGRLGAPQSVNKYAYAMNDPVNRIDPTGLLDEPTCMALGFPGCGGGGSNDYYGSLISDILSVGY